MEPLGGGGGGGGGGMRRKAAVVLGATAAGVVAMVALLLLSSSGADDGTGGVVRRLLRSPLADGVRDKAVGDVHGDGAAHKVLWPLNRHDLATLMLVTLGLVIAAGGGIGSGGILVPLYILGLGYSPKYAIALSNITILGGAIANTLHAVRSRHPSADRPLVDWNLILMMEPTTIVGAIGGSFANKLLPEPVISLLLLVVLGLLAHLTLNKGMAMFQAEGGWANLWTHERHQQRRPHRAAAAPSTPPRHSQLLDPAAAAAAADAALPGGATSPSPTGKKKRRSMGTKIAPVPAEAAAEGNAAARGGGKEEPTKWLGIAGQEVVGYGSLEKGAGAGAGAGDAGGNSSISSGRKARSNRKTIIPGSSGENRMGPEEEPEFVGYQTLGVSALRSPYSPYKPGLIHRQLGFDTELDRLLEAERTTPAWKPLALTACFLGIVTTECLKGGGEGAPSPLGIECGSLGYWVVTLAALPWVASFFLWVRRWILADYESKVRSGYIFLTGDIRWTSRNTVIYPLVCTMAGIFAGVFGLGGGIVKGPLMLEMNVLPAVASASAACMVLYTSAAASFAFYMFGMIPVDYGVVLFCLGFVCTWFGQACGARMLKRYGKESFIVLSIAAVMCISTAATGFHVVLDILKDPSRAMRAGTLCA